MDNFSSGGFNDPFSTSSDLTSPSGSSQPTRKCGLHWLQTLLVLLVTAIVSYIFGHLLDIRYAANPFLHPNLVLHTSLFLAALSASILLTVFFLEIATSAMTPYFSRKPQLIVLLSSVLLCALIGALCELFFVNGYIKPLIAPAPTPVITASPTPTPTPTATLAPTPTPVPVSNDIILFALDKSGSMTGSRDQESTSALKKITQNMGDHATLGLVAFCDKIIDTVPLKKNTADHRQTLLSAASCNTQGTTSFSTVMATALDIVQKAALPNDAHVKLVFITDGAGNNIDPYIAHCKQLNVHVSCVMIGGSDKNHVLRNVVDQTGGMFVTAAAPSDILGQTQTVILQNTPVVTARSKPTPTASPVPTPSPTPLPKIGNMIYVTPDSDAYLAAMFILFGLVLGITLTLMLSLQGQFRIQLILSPLMGLCAFLLIHYAVIPKSQSWMAYLLFGLVFMRRNNPVFGSRPNHTPSSSQPMNDDFSF